VTAREDAERDAVEELAVGHDRATDLVDDARAGRRGFGDVHIATTRSAPKSVVGIPDIAAGDRNA
jgi:hypothetical protein